MPSAVDTRKGGEASKNFSKNFLAEIVVYSGRDVPIIPASTEQPAWLQATRWPVNSPPGPRKFLSKENVLMFPILPAQTPPPPTLTHPITHSSHPPKSP